MKRITSVSCLVLVVGYSCAITSGESLVRHGVKEMWVSNLDAIGCVLPQYRWSCKWSGAEFAESGYCMVANTPNYQPQRPLNYPCDPQSDPRCPDYVFNGIWEDARTQTLPYTVQNVYDRNQTKTEVPVVVLENEFLEATVTPQWGGRLWALKDKKTGKDLFMDNKFFQPNNDALRQAYLSGGSEWNFGTQIGHMSQTAEPVYVGYINTTDHGPILRIYVFERISGAVWQVDLLLPSNSSVLWVHITLTNPTDDTIPAYWWTNVGVDVDTDGSLARRILTPATNWVSDSPGAALPPWPLFHERGSFGEFGTGSFDNVSSWGDYSYPDYPDAGPIDHSYSFLWWEKRDVWFDLTSVQDRTVRFNGFVDKEGGFMIHGHPNNGTKAWIWGTSPNEVWWQNFGGATELDDDHGQPFPEHSKLPHKSATRQRNTYTELQVGVMPTQYQSFPLDGSGGVREWTEFFTTDDLNTNPSLLNTLHKGKYHSETVPACDDWMETRGLGGKNHSEYAMMDKFLKEHSAVGADDLKLLSSPPSQWGAIQQQLSNAKSLAGGVKFDLDVGKAMADRVSRPWAELATNGKFSSKSLSQHAISFQISEAWVKKLEEMSPTTWLQQFHLGVATLERSLIPGDADFMKAKVFFEASEHLHNTPEVQRNLAIIDHAGQAGVVAPNHTKAFERYKMAFEMLASSADVEGAVLLQRDMGAELAYSFALLVHKKQIMAPQLQELVAKDSFVPAVARSQDRFRFAEVVAALQGQRFTELYDICDCSPGKQWPSLGWNLRQLSDMYVEAKIQEEAVILKRNLSVYDINRVKRKANVPECIRAIGH
eukprot:m.138951 g.138951  ORF g.138951 m.138951 type:complete len:823 (+) comp30026_c1_seq1:97-2565(+)